MRTRKVKIFLMAAPVLVGGAAVMAYYLNLKPRERPLLPRATRITSLSRAHPFYWWVSDHELLRFRDLSAGDRTFVRLDVNTRQERPSDRLTRLFSRSGGRPESIQVAPDGEWMLWTGANGETVVCTSDGATHFHYPGGKPSEKRWMAEGLRWVELLHDDNIFTQAVMHNVLTPKESKNLPLVPTISCSPSVVNVARMATTTDDHILATLWSGRPGGLQPATVLAMVMNAHINGVGQFRMEPPREAERGELVFAPIYGQLAWVLEYQSSWPGSTGERGRTGLWVADMHGSQRREIGSLEGTGDAKNGMGPVAVQWCPDGNRLSFVYRDALWTVPVD